MERDDVLVRVQHDLCTGDGLCAQYAPEVFELDIDGIAYVKTPGGDLLTSATDAAVVPAHLLLDVVDSAKECPGECIYVTRADGTPVAGPDAA